MSVGGAKETVYTIYVLDAQQRMVHVVSLRQLMLADRNQKVLEVGPQRVPLSVKPTTDREDVARLLSKYNLLAVPVVDEGGHLLGIVTVDDVIDAIVREQTEDVQKFGGMEALDEPYMEISLVSMIKKRAGWLCALFLGEMLTATAMGYFEGEISKAVVLALFIPLIISSGGNSGSQATSLIIRAMALREVTLRDWWRVASRELPSGMVLGLILGVIGFIRITIWQRFGWYDYGTHHTLVALTVVGCARRRGDVRLACGLHAAVRASPAQLRSGERIGALRCNARRRHRPDHLFQRRVRDPPRHAALAPAAFVRSRCFCNNKFSRSSGQIGAGYAPI